MLDETRPQELLGVVEESWKESYEPARNDEADSDWGTREKVLSELTLMTLFGRREDRGRGDEVRLEALTLSGSVEAVVRLDKGRVNPETPGLTHGCWLLPWM